MDDVVATVRYAAENHIADPRPRGAARAWPANRWAADWCSISRRYLRRILSIDDERVRVQPGVVLATLNRQSGRNGPTVWPRPRDEPCDDAWAAWWRSTPRAVIGPRYGSARQHVAVAEIVLADGEVLARSGGIAVTRAQPTGDDGRAPLRNWTDWCSRSPG